MSQNQELTVDQFRAVVRSYRVTCAICGFKSHSIVAHLRESHNQSVGQYRKAYPNAPVSSPIVQEFLRSMGREPRSVASTLQTEVRRLFGGVAADVALDDFKNILSWMSFGPELDELIPATNPDFEFTPNAKSIALGLALGRNCYISGPPGCGKTEEVKQVMAALKVPCPRANMNGDVTYATFVGNMKANASGTYFQYGLLPKAMLGGYPVLLDEIDFTPANIGAVLHPVLERNGSLYIQETGEHIKAKRGFCIYGTGNTGGRGDSVGAFAGVETLNSAFLDRFSIRLVADYLPSSREEALIMRAFPNVSSKFARKVAIFSENVRAARAADTLTFVWSIRKVLDFVELALHVGAVEALNLTMYHWLDGEELNLVTALETRVELLKEPVL